MNRMQHSFTVRDLSGEPGPYLVVKANLSSDLPVYVWAPRFCLLDEDTALELADMLVDVVEQGRARNQ